MASTILLSDNGASSGSAGLKQTAGNDGVLILQTTTSGGTATNAIYIDTTQNVMVNTTSNAGYWSKSVTLNGSAGSTADAGMDFIGYRAGDGDVGGVGFLNAASSNARIAGIFGERSGANNSGALTFYTMNAGSAAERVKILSTGGTQFNYGISVGGTAPSTDGTGIKFPATQVASSDANTLDDYEEGTWSPSFSDTSGSSTGLTYSVQVGKYTKVGNVVTVQGYFRLSSKGSLSGNVRFSNLPFANISTTNAYAAPGFPAFLDTTGITVYGGIFGDFPPSVTYMTLYYGNGSSGANLTFANIQNTFGMEFNFSYLTST